jgi:excisionase family DNA binding protein
MDTKTANLSVLRNLELLNKQVSDLIKLQRKEISGYDYINSNELAELLGESIKTIYARVHKREIPYYKPGGKLLLFKLSEIKDWVKSGKHESIEELEGRL